MRVLALWLLLSLTQAANAYGILTHQQIIDHSWESTIVPILLGRFPSLSPAELRKAHAYAYGGSVIQDPGYYPFSKAFFSELTHYVRTGIVQSPFRNARNANELACNRRARPLHWRQHRSLPGHEPFRSHRVSQAR